MGAMWWFKDKWNNLKIPQSGQYDAHNPQSQRRYWGWNEIPLDNTKVNNAQNWDAVVIKLPPAICAQGTGKDDKIDCLSFSAKTALEKLIDWYVQHNYLVPGSDHITSQPGSYVVFLKEYFTGSNKAWQREFFCSAWTSPNNKYSVVYNPISPSDKTGACYMDNGKGPVPPGPGPPAPPPPPGPVKGGVIRLRKHTGKCLDITGGSLKNGNKLEIWECNNVAANQNWVWDSANNALRTGANPQKCLDFGEMNNGSPAQIWDCNGNHAQFIRYDEKSGNYHNYNGGCLDLWEKNLNHGSLVQTWDCGGKWAWQQQWTGPPQWTGNSSGLEVVV